MPTLNDEQRQVGEYLHNSFAKFNEAKEVNKMAKITKLYAAYKAGYLGDNILDTYFSFTANMIAERHVSTVEDTEIAAMFMERYDIELPLPFLRQVLGVGVKNNSFIEDHGKYSVDFSEISKYQFDETDFNKQWGKLIEEFEAFCNGKGIDVSSIDINSFILGILNESDEKILSGEKVDEPKGMPAEEYAWYSFVREQGEAETDLYSFIAALSASNITKQALFFNGEAEPDFSGLSIYLDSPIIFALLGIDDKSRTDAYRTLVAEMQKANCSVHVLDHNFQEVDGIIARASVWATDVKYDLRKANNATRFFHDSQMNETEISEFCANIETKLNEMGITVKKTSYDIYQDRFQEDETCLFNMIQSRYKENGYELTPDKEASIRVDVRSIIMIYRERQGQTATRIQNAKHIMLTSNNAIANVSKKYESNQSDQAGHIPACISADLFGAILWLNSPIRQLDYQKQKLLADCYAFLKPDKKLLDKYIQSLDEARNADEIDEKKYLFLRTHKVVLDSLMDITKGDYARFNSNTYLEVYEDIQAKSLKKYRDEASAHDQTKEKLRMLEESSIEERRKNNDEIQKLQDRVNYLEDQTKEQKKKERERKIKWFGWITTIILIGIPYLVLLVVIELLKTQFADVSWRSAHGITGTIIATFIAGLLFAIGKKKCFDIVRSIIEKHSKD